MGVGSDSRKAYPSGATPASRQTGPANRRPHGAADGNDSCHETNRLSCGPTSPAPGAWSMIRFACPKCDKGLRADDAKAGGLVACPACGHKFRIPEPVAEPEVVEEVEAEEEPSPRRGKRRKFRRKPTDVDRGR